jgi:metal-responsive CopG/Arc/MetJ family transcriptional regulator
MGSRTTIRLDDDLMRQLKERAKREEVSLTRLFNDAIRQWLHLPKKQPKRKPFVQKTHNMGLPLIDITHTNAVLDELDVEEFRRKMAMGQ